MCVIGRKISNFLLKYSVFYGIILKVILMCAPVFQEAIFSGNISHLLGPTKLSPQPK